MLTEEAIKDVRKELNVATSKTDLFIALASGEALFGLSMDVFASVRSP